ncbi:hypothetical protein [Planomonospora alba]|uniref:hypothetical protein n=1 Tax=Planomonospora alba TaxID=161354 RepID=UPI0031E65F03
MITLKEVYDEMRELISEVRQLTSEYKNSKQVDEDHERRIRSLERWMYAIPASVFLAIASIVVALVNKG